MDTHTKSQPIGLWGKDTLQIKKQLDTLGYSTQPYRLYFSENPPTLAALLILERQRLTVLAALPSTRLLQPTFIMAKRLTPIEQTFCDRQGIQCLSAAQLHTLKAKLIQLNQHKAETPLTLVKQLSNRQILIFRHLLKAHAEVKIAETLNISTQTVRLQTKQIFAQLAVRSLEQLIGTYGSLCAAEMREKTP